MRPVIRPAWSNEWQRYPIVDVAVQAFGRYCSMCERYIPQGQRAWRASIGKLIEGRARRGAWDDILVLCPTCARAARRHRQPETVLRPDVDRTFALDAPTPFRYELRRVPAEVIAMVHGLRLTVPAGEVAVVVPTTPRAADTLRYFALDTPLTSGIKVEMPQAGEDDQVEIVDPRVELRTEAWMQAVGYVAQLREIDEPLTRRALFAQMGHLIEYGGFWSVWATILWEAFGDVELLERLLMPPTAPRARLGAEPSARMGDAQWHRNTRADWLPEPDRREDGADDA